MNAEPGDKYADDARRVHTIDTNSSCSNTHTGSGSSSTNYYCLWQWREGASGRLTREADAWET